MVIRRRRRSKIAGIQCITQTGEGAVHGVEVALFGKAQLINARDHGGMEFKKQLHDLRIAPAAMCFLLDNP